MRSFVLNLRIVVHCLIFTLFSGAGAIAQFQQAVISPYMPPGYFMHYSDLWNVSITLEPLNQSSQDPWYFLEIGINDAAGRNLWKARTYTFRITENPYWITSGSQNDLQPVSVLFSDAEWYRKLTVGGGVFPPENYIITYKLVQTTYACTTAGKLIAEISLSKNIKTAYPPSLLFPFDKDTLNNSEIIFTWIPPFPVYTESGFSYKLKISEIHDEQDPVSAITSNGIYFLSDFTAQTQMYYPLSGRPLKEGKQYAWQIEAYNSHELIAFSQVWTFTIRENKRTPTPVIIPKIYFELSSDYETPFYTIDTTWIAFNYEERYNDSDAELNYALTDEFTKTTVLKGALFPLAVRKGRNYYALDLTGIDPGWYSLRLTDEKNIKRYLKFRYETGEK